MSGRAKRNALAVFGAALVFSVAGCSAPTLMQTREGAFEQAVSAMGSKRPLLALRAAFRYLKGAGPDDPRYDRALRVMAVAANELGLPYAASIWYLQIAQGGRDPALLPVAIEGLQQLVERGVHDDELIVSGYLASADLAALPAGLMAFVDYHAGLDSLRRGERSWADQRFAKIGRASPYAWRVRYVRAVDLVAARDLDQAQQALEAMLTDADDPNREGPATLAPLPSDLRNDVERSLARLHFERGRWEQALVLYDRVRARTPTDASLLLEMAWTHFYHGETRRALGLLVALDAPAFASLIAPERFLLEAMCLRRLCQFEPARAAAVRLRGRYAAVYAGIETGRPLLENAPLVRAAELDPRARAIAQLEAELAREARRIKSELGEGLEPELVASLDELYRRGLDEIGRRKSERLQAAVAELAEELLLARDDVRFTTHELAVALLRGRMRPEGPRERDVGGLGASDGKVVYRFVGEYWKDELDDLLVLVEDRCIE